MLTLPLTIFLHCAHAETVWNERAGIGDRFFQYIVGLTYALHVGGACGIALRMTGAVEAE